MILGDVLKYLNGLCAVINQKYGPTAKPSSLSDSTLENTGDVTMTFRIVESTRSCSVLPSRILGGIQPRYNIAPVDLNVDLLARNFGLWTTSSSRDLLETIDFSHRLNIYLAEKGLK